MRIQIFLLLCLMHSFSWATDDTTGEIRLIDMHNPAQPFEMAAKLQWNPHHQRWDKVLVLYNGCKKPPMKHPVWQYLKGLSIPARQANVKGENLHYKTFKLNAYCTDETALQVNKPVYIGFDNHDVGSYNERAFMDDWQCPEWRTGTDNIRVVAEGRSSHGKSLRFLLPKGEAGCRKGKCISWKARLGKPLTHIQYSYWVKFPSHFDFVRGGKLPGVGSDVAGSGGHKATGYNGWSVRVMWDKDGKLGQYIYHPDQPKRFGEFFEWDMQPIVKDQWHQIKTEIRLNHAGKRDGMIKTWLNGRLVFEKANFRLRNSNTLPIERLLFSVFYGGEGPDWQPSQDNYLYIDDWVILGLE